MTVEKLEAMSDDDLTAHTHKMASDLSYYNAAEGNSWSQEETQRDICQIKFRAARDEMKRRGLAFENKNYLIPPER